MSIVFNGRSCILFFVYLKNMFSSEPWGKTGKLRKRVRSADDVLYNLKTINFQTKHEDQTKAKKIQNVSLIVNRPLIMLIY